MLKPCVSLEIISAEAFGVQFPGAVSTRPSKARSCRLGRGPGAGQGHRMDCQGTCDVPHAPTGAARRKGARRLTKRPGLLSDLHVHWERFGEHERKEEHV